MTVYVWDESGVVAVSRSPAPAGVSAITLAESDLPSGDRNRWRIVDGALSNDKPATADMVRAEAQRRLEAIIAPYRGGERETWPIQVDQAKAFQADNAAITPMLDALAEGRSGSLTTATRAEMAARILANAAAFEAVSSAILEAQQVLLAMQTIPADYDDDARWP